MKHYVGLHHHRHGISSYILKSDHEPSEDEFVAVLEEEFEEDREDEYLEVIECPITQLTEPNEGVTTKLYVGLHHHAHGTSTYILESDQDPIEDDLEKHLVEEFEPDDGEWLEVVKTGVTEVV
jgi:hypothetical protein